MHKTILETEYDELTNLSKVKTSTTHRFIMGPSLIVECNQTHNGMKDCFLCLIFFNPSHLKLRKPYAWTMEDAIFIPIYERKKQIEVY